MMVAAYALFTLGLFFLVVIGIIGSLPFSALSYAQQIASAESMGTLVIACFVGSATAKYLSRS